MKRSLIAAAVLSCIGGTAMAQNVTIYGIVDASIVREDTGDHNEYRLDSGRNAASRLGFRGSEDLGGGLKAVFLLESQMNISDGSTEDGQFWSRLAYVGLEGDFGGVRLGRQDSPMRTALNVIDPFANSGMAGAIDFFGYTPQLVGSAISASSTMERVNNQVTYILPSNLGGVNGSLAYVFGEASGSVKAQSAYAGNIGYSVGGLALQAAYSRQNALDPAGVDTSDDIILGATYDFGFMKLHGGYHNIDAKDATGAKIADVDSFLLGVTVPIGDKMKLRGWYISNSEGAVGESDSSAEAISLTYSLSKRTTLYATFVATQNDSLAQKAPIADNVDPTGASGNAIAFGIQHNF